jgi:transposase
VIQAPDWRGRIMRYELTDDEWAAIKPMLLPNKPRGVPRVNDRHNQETFMRIAIRRIGRARHRASLAQALRERSVCHEYW